MDELLKKRSAHYAKINRLIAYTNAIDLTKVDSFAVQVKYKRLEELSIEFSTNQEQIEKLCADDTALKTELAKRVKFDDEIDQLETQLTRLLTSTTSSTRSSPPKTHSNVKLPAMELPTFDGNIQNWRSFHDIFRATIHKNSSLEKSQKLSYLKSVLVGEASSLIKFLSITDANYDIAWKQLRERYTNNRELLFSVLERLVGQKSLPGNSSKAVRSLIDTTNECIQSLKDLTIPVEHWDAIILFHLYQKLDLHTKELWEQKLTDKSIPPLTDFMEFLEQRYRTLGAAGINPKSKNDGQAARVHHTQVQQCKVCKIPPNHFIFKCSIFLGKTLLERKEIVRKQSLCFNCLREGHSAARCQSKFFCRTCNKKHHSLLHNFNNKEEPNRDQNRDTGQVDSSPEVVNHSSNATCINQAILATASIRVRDVHGQDQVCRAFLDGGATSSFITEACVKRLGLSRQYTSVRVMGLASAPVATARGVLTLNIRPHFESSTRYELNTFILSKVTNQLPHSACDPSAWSHLQGIQLADPEFHRPAKIDILLGADLFWNLIMDGRRPGRDNSPVGIRSTLGWLVAGNLHSTSNQAAVHISEVQFGNINQFWELEQIPTTRVLTK